MSVKNLLVLGATGGVGRQVVEQALALGHSVAAMVRDPKKMAIRHERLRLVVGDVTADAPPLPEAMRGEDAVISALGVGASFQPNALIERSAPKIVAAMQQVGVQRLLMVSAFGVGATFVDVPIVPRIFMRTLLARIYADKEAGEAIVRQSALDWTLVYPTGLTDGPKTGKILFGERLRLSGFPTISRADVAAFLLAELETRRFPRTGVLVSS